MFPTTIVLMWVGKVEGIGITFVFIQSIISSDIIIFLCTVYTSLYPKVEHDIFSYIYFSTGRLPTRSLQKIIQRKATHICYTVDKN